MRILIATYYKYPKGDAGSIRQHSFAKAFQNTIHEVLVIGVGEFTNFNKKEFDNVPYISLRHKGSLIISRIMNILLYKKNLKRVVASYNANIILVNDLPISAILWLKRYAKKNSIKLMYDCVEWYSPEQFRLGKLSLPYILKEINNKIIIDKRFSVVCISKYLYNYFRKRNIVTIRIPVILDVKNTACKKSTDPNIITLLYAGSPGKKDYVKEIVEGCALLDQNELGRIELKLIGIKKEQLVSDCNVKQETIDKIGGHLNAMGRIPREQVLEQLEGADFTVLLRSHSLRYAKAGFPTKVVESLASATPVICNITSDLGDYLVDGENSIIVEECDAQAFCEAVKKALKLTKEEKEKMHNSARRTAEESFDYRLYRNELFTLLNNNGGSGV